MIHTEQPLRSGITSHLNRIVAECEDFGARYQYSPRLMMLGAIFAGVRLSKSVLLR